ncbi:SDR family oxidoreductase [Bacillus marinisedimentorum]|uniref:SDR family oxidoreductase n=1 Tax=Bacillus marinisedimentorum TaxID=1821260 RepID=UPI0009F3AB64|nr:SDR family oxidoreductase [Bacillus marinisedimentorum]
MEKTALVTGASSGFGLLSAEELAAKGYHVLAAMRNPDKAKQAEQHFKQSGLSDQIKILMLDVTDNDSIKNMEEELLKLRRLDVLVNNAGFAMGGFAEELDLSEYEEQFSVNVFGMMAVTNTVLPLMRENRSGKIINIGSISGRAGFPGLSAYVASKFAVEGYSESLRLELKPFSIDVVIVEPGSYRTNIWKSGRKMGSRTGTIADYHNQMQQMEAYLKEAEGGYGDPREVAELIAMVAEKRNPAFRYPVGKGIRAFLAAKERLPWKIWEKLVLKHLFK